MSDRRIIAHIDLDAFFYSCEVLRRPELAGKPVLIAGRSPRSVVATASYEARAHGAHSGMPASTAARLVPGGIFVSPDIAYYRQVSQQVFGLVRQVTDIVQQVSVDEAYLDISLVEQPVQRMRQLQQQIADDLQLTCSIGIGPNRLVAKMCSDYEKPRGLTIMSMEMAREAFAQESPRLIPGIGPKTNERLEEFGVHTIKQLQDADIGELQQRFGQRTGLFLWQRAMFMDEEPVVTERVRKSISVERTYSEDLEELDELLEEIDSLSAELAALCSKHDAAGRTVSIKVRTDDFHTVTRARTVNGYTRDEETIRKAARGLLKALSPSQPVRLLGVRLSALQAAEEAVLDAAEDVKPVDDTVVIPEPEDPQLRLPI